MAMIYRAEGGLQDAVEELRRLVDLDELMQHFKLESDRSLLAHVEKELSQNQE